MAKIAEQAKGVVESQRVNSINIRDSLNASQVTIVVARHGPNAFSWQSTNGQGLDKDQLLSRAIHIWENHKNDMKKPQR